MPLSEEEELSQTVPPPSPRQSAGTSSSGNHGHRPKGFRRSCTFAAMSSWSAPLAPATPNSLDTVTDFEDLLAAFNKHGVRYLIIGGLAFIYHAKPRYTKDMDLWVDPAPGNIERANAALAEFGSPYDLSGEGPDEILQLGLPPNRVDLLLSTGDFSFQDAWDRREKAPYGSAEAHWIDLDTLIEIKRRIDHPRHREDVRVLEAVRQRQGLDGK